MDDATLLNRHEILAILATLAGMALLLGVVAFLPKLGRRIFHRIERWLARIAHKSWRAVLLVSVVSFVLSASITIVGGVPKPHVHDEFCYLLAADTFAHGRLTNPAVPVALVPFFETMHELVRPTYASKYFPAQGLMLALGQVLTGYPIVGDWLSTAIACGAVTWALLRWIRPPKWGLLVGLLIAIHPIVIDWASCYWGGSVSLCGGALIFGAIPRLRRAPKACDGFALGIGFAILFNSRPYEGALWGVAVAVTVLCWLIGRTGPKLAVLMRTMVLPAGLVLVTAGCWIGYYNYRVTGNALLLPDKLHTQQYMAVPRFYWSAPQPPKTYNSKAMRDQYDVFERNYFEQQLTPRGWASFLLTNKIPKFITFYVRRSFFLTAGLLAVPWALRRQKGMPLALAYALWFAIGWAIIPWFEPHYAAALFPVVAFLAAGGVRCINAWRWRGAGRMFIRWCVVLAFLLVVPFVRARMKANNLDQWWVWRTDIKSQLEKSGGRHLVIVRYGPDHVTGYEWVYNPADFSNAPVLWAREMSQDQMPTLLDYARDRRIWLLDLKQDDQHPELTPYPIGANRQ